MPDSDYSGLGNRPPRLRQDLGEEQLGPIFLGIVEKLFRGTFFDDLPVIKHENPVGYLFGLVPSGTQIDELEALIADC